MQHAHFLLREVSGGSRCHSIREWAHTPPLSRRWPACVFSRALQLCVCDLTSGLKRNAGKVAFSDFELRPPAEIVRVQRAKSGKVAFFDFQAKSFAEIVGVHRANAGKVAFSDFELRPSAEIVRVHCAKPGKVAFFDFQAKPFVGGCYREKNQNYDNQKKHDKK